MQENIRSRPIWHTAMPPHWIGKPMHSLRLATILANLRRVRP